MLELGKNEGKKEELLVQINMLEGQHKINPQVHIKNKLDLVLARLKILDASIIAKEILYDRQKYFEQANKLGKVWLICYHQKRMLHLFQQ